MVGLALKTRGKPVGVLALLVVINISLIQVHGNAGLCFLFYIYDTEESNIFLPILTLRGVSIFLTSYVFMQ